MRTSAAWTFLCQGDLASPSPTQDRVRCTRRSGRHRLTADGPPGTGDHLGLTPYDLLLAALGTCTSMTLRTYADRHDWPLEHVTVQLHHDRVHADACRDPEAHPTLAIRAQRHCASSTGEPPRTCACDGCCT
jgi:hypothetical protein